MRYVRVCSKKYDGVFNRYVAWPEQELWPPGAYEGTIVQAHDRFYGRTRKSAERRALRWIRWRNAEIDHKVELDKTKRCHPV